MPDKIVCKYAETASTQVDCLSVFLPFIPGLIGKVIVEEIFTNASVLGVVG